MNAHRLKKYELKSGDSGQPVAILKDLLYSLGDIPRAVPLTRPTYQRPAVNDKYDETLVAAVSHFQKAEGLPVTGIPDLETWAEIGYVVNRRKVDFHTQHDPELRTLLNGTLRNTTTAAAWPSQLRYVTHQRSCDRVLEASLSREDLDRLKFAVKDADKPEWQTVEYSYRHAMTPSGMSKEEARRKANEFVRDEITTARRLYERGNHSDGMLRLGYGMHCLQDATSPAHAGFKEYGGGGLELGEHMHKELFDPRGGSWLDEATKRAYLYFKGKLEMQGDLFANLGFDIWVPDVIKARRRTRIRPRR